MTDLAQLEAETLAAVAAASDEAALENVRVGALGKKGSISALLSTLGKMSPDERKTAGAAINALKDKVTEALGGRRAVLKEAALDARLKAETIDVTLPTREAGIETGRIHPISQVMDELTAIFADLGFSIAEGPDIETDDYNFTKLNSHKKSPNSNLKLKCPICTVSSNLNSVLTFHVNNHHGGESEVPSPKPATVIEVGCIILNHEYIRLPYYLNKILLFSDCKKYYSDR